MDANVTRTIFAIMHAHAEMLTSQNALSQIARLPTGKAAIIAAGGRAAITAAKRHASAEGFADQALAKLV